MNRLSFTKELFAVLAEKDSEYVLLKHIAPRMEEHDAHSDLDILLPNGVQDSLKNFINAHQDIEFVRWQTWSDRTAAFIFFKTGEFLQLDFLKHLARKAWIYLPTRIVLSNKKRNEEGIVVSNERCVLEHAILFNFLNNSGLTPKYLNYYQSFDRKDQQQLTDQFNFKYGLDLNSLTDLSEFDNKILKRFQNCLQSQPENNFIPSKMRYLSYLKNSVFNNFFRFNGSIITFSGVDGAGKSTILAAVKSRLENDYRQNVVVLRHRPGLLPILSAWTKGKEQAEKEAAAKLPHSGQSSSIVSASLRFLYYFLDYLIGQFWVWGRYQTRGKIVLYDRYYYDFMADKHRSNVSQLPTWLTSVCFKFIRRPDLNVFLFTDKDRILSRKKELSPETITHLTENYRSLFNQLGQKSPNAYLQIENVELKDTLELIMKKFRLMMSK
jgi:thymidylate kinase